MDIIFNIWIGIFLRFLFWYDYIVRTIYSFVQPKSNCIVLTLYTILYYIRGSDLCALFMYCFTSPTQILRVLAAPTKLVPATTHIARCPSRANGGAPVPAPMVALPLRRLLTFVRPTPVPPKPYQVHLSHSSLVSSNHTSNGGALVLLLPFRRALKTVRTTPVPPPPIPHSS